MTDYKFEPATSNAFIAEYISWREAVSDAPREYSEALALGILAAVAGRRLRVPVRQQPRPVPCNLFLCLLGPSTAARKSTELSAAEFLLNETASDAVMDAPGSPEGFLQDLADHHETGGVLMYDEIAWTFSAIKRRQHLQDLKGYFLRAYDNSPISRRLRDKRVRGGGEVEDADMAPDPALTVLAASTPERLAMVSARDDVEDGWWPRWAFVWPESLPERRPLGPPDDTTDRSRAAILEALRTLEQRLAGGLACGVQALLTPDAWATADAAMSGIEDLALADTENAALFGRSELRLLKLAALLALADDPCGTGNVRVEVEHVEDAERLTRRWLDAALRFAELIGLNEFESAVSRALAALKRRRGHATRREIAQVTHVPKRLMDEIENTLADRGTISIIEGSKDSKEWRLLT